MSSFPDRSILGQTDQSKGKDYTQEVFNLDMINKNKK